MRCRVADDLHWGQSACFPYFSQNYGRDWPRCSRSHLTLHRGFPGGGGTPPVGRSHNAPGLCGCSFCIAICPFTAACRDACCTWRSASDRLRIEFHVASFVDPSPAMREAFAALHIEVRCIGDNGYRQPAQRLGWLIEERGIDIVVATTFKAYLCSKWAAQVAAPRSLSGCTRFRGS